MPGRGLRRSRRAHAHAAFSPSTAARAIRSRSTSSICPTALANFAADPFVRCFVGHTRVPGVYVLERDGRVAAAGLLAGAPVPLRPDARYIINVGSVGQPRDGDPRAAYALFDTQPQTVTLVRVAYSVAFTQAKMRAAGLPEDLADRLQHGR